MHGELKYVCCWDDAFTPCENNFCVWPVSEGHYEDDFQNEYIKIKRILIIS